MSAVPKVGGTFLHRGRQIRSSRTTVELEGVEIDVEYIEEGRYIPETDSTPAEYPVAIVLAAQIGGVEVWPLFRDTRLGEKLESAVERQVMPS